MYFSRQFFLCLLVIACVFAIEFRDVGNADMYCDNIVSELLSQEEVLDQINPLHFPDIKHGKLSTKNGKLYGLANSRRMGHCSYTIEDKNRKGEPMDTLFAEVDAGVENLTFSMDYTVRLLFFPVDGHVEGRIGVITANVTAHLNEEDNIHMNSFNVSRFDSIEVTKVSAVIPQSSFILKTIVNMIVKDKRQYIKEALENAVVDLINEKIENFKLD